MMRAQFLSYSFVTLMAAGAAQAWTFESNAATGLIRASDGAAARMMLSCTRQGIPGRDSETIEWRVESSALVTASNTADGEVTQIALGFDPETKASGPFIRQGAALATGLGYSSALLERLRNTETLALSSIDETVSVRFSLSGFSAALDQMIEFCSAPATPGDGQTPDILSSCDAPPNETVRAICTTPALRDLETTMAQAKFGRQQALSGPPLEAFNVDQAAWENLRESCGANVSCLQNATQGRIAFLQQQAGGENPQQAAVQQTAPAATESAAPAPLQIAPVQPVAPAQFGGVLYDNRQITQRVIIEIIRQQPLFLDSDRILREWYRVAIGQGKQPQGATELAVARDHLSRSVAAQPPGPFVIAYETRNPFAQATYEGGVLALPGQNNPYDRNAVDLRRFNVPVQSLGNLSVRATSHFDISRLQVGAAQAETFKDDALRLLISTQINQIVVVGTPDTSFDVFAAGQTRFVGLKRVDPPQQHANPKPLRRLNPALLVANFAPAPVAPPAGGLDHLAQVLAVGRFEGALLEGPSNNRGSGFPTLLRLASVKAHPPQVISERLRGFAVNVLADPVERDHIIPPINIDQYQTNEYIQFSRHIDEFDRGELEDRIDGMLWPRITARLPQAPFEVIARLNTDLGQYDRSLGGFPLQASATSMGLAGQGDFPALKSLPEFLPVPEDQARELVSYFDTTFGPGVRRVTFALRYRITDISPVEWDSGQLPTLAIEPLSLSLHVTTDDVLGPKIAEFDVAAYRGDPPPVANAERVAFWKAIADTARSTEDDVTLAALGVGENNQFLSQLIEDSDLVRATNDFDKPAARDNMRAQLAAATKPDKLVLTGSLNLTDYSLSTQRYGTTYLRFGYERGDMGLPRPEVRLSDSTLLQPLDMPQDMARVFAAGGQSTDGRANLIAWVEPDLLTYENNKPILYVRPTRIVLSPDATDATGYPVVYLEVAIPDSSAAAIASEPMAQLQIDPPTSLPLDSEYVDLVMVREEGDTLTEETYLRMMEDRRLRELTAAQIGYDLPWGNFFRSQDTELNPSQRRALLPAFTEWTKSRAAQIPETVYLQTPAGSVPGNMQCWTTAAAPQNYAARQMPAGLAQALDAIEYRKKAINLSTLMRSVGNMVHRQPEAVYVLFGRPSLRGSGQQVDTRTGYCAAQRSRNSWTVPSEGAHWNALIVVDGAFRAPLEQGKSQMLRDIGTVEMQRIGANTIALNLTATRSEVIEITNENGQLRLSGAGTLDETDLAQPPATADVFGISPHDNWSTALEAAAERLPEARVAKSDGPPQNARMATENTVLGPTVQFNAFRNGHFFFDSDRNEVLAVLREAERDPDRVLAVASYRRFDPGTVTQEQLVGALLRKYGPDPVTAEDNSLYGQVPAQVLSWGSRAGCLPNMRDELRPEWAELQQDPAIRELQNLAGSFRAPSVNYSGAYSVIYSRCKPTVWAMVGQDQNGVMNLIVWSLDMALLDEVAQRPDPAIRADGAEGSQTLMDNAAEIDL